MTEFRADPARIDEMYGLLTSVNKPLPETIDASVVFGRKSPELVSAGVETATRSGVTILTGYTGGDSGDLYRQGVTEAGYLSEGIRQIAGTDLAIIEETKARSGLENAQYATEILAALGGFMGGIATITGVSHPTQSLRLHGGLRAELARQGVAYDLLTHYGSQYRFDSTDPSDQYEAAREIARVAAAAKGRRPAIIVPELPNAELVEYAGMVVAGLGREFKRRGIKNPSTAIDTNPAISPLAMMLEAPKKGGQPNRILSAADIARALFKEVRARRGM